MYAEADPSKVQQGSSEKFGTASDDGAEDEGEPSGTISTSGVLTIRRPRSTVFSKTLVALITVTSVLAVILSVIAILARIIDWGFATSIAGEGEKFCYRLNDLPVDSEFSARTEVFSL